MMRSGVLYPLAVKEHHTKEIAGSVWRGLPTPRAGHHHIESEEAIQKREKRLGRKISRPLGNVLMNLPTPSCNDSKNNPCTPCDWDRHSSLSVEVAKMTGETKETIGKDARLHPHFVEWMMGFPIGYTDLKH
tara:strand:- start:1107 stop:1502 length:396 start_codon:yes stop_codon:yes gene_type:complete